MLLRMADYISINKAMWDERAPAHAASPGYSFDRLISDPEGLSGVVRFDRPRLGDLAGQRGVHLQCHIGTDTVSLARLGARMTGLDFSSVALAHARRLAQRNGADVDFHEAEVYDAVDVLGPAAFDFVYTRVGALCWLPDVARWARVVADLLRPGGRLFIREGHPMRWALDDQSDALTLRCPYFEHAEPVVNDLTPKSGDYQVMAKDLIRARGFVRHDSDKLAQAVREIAQSVGNGHASKTRVRETKYSLFAP